MSTDDFYNNVGVSIYPSPDPLISWSDNSSHSHPNYNPVSAWNFFTFKEPQFNSTNYKIFAEKLRSNLKK